MTKYDEHPGPGENTSRTDVLNKEFFDRIFMKIED